MGVSWAEQGEEGRAQPLSDRSLGWCGTVGVGVRETCEDIRAPELHDTL